MNGFGEFSNQRIIWLIKSIDNLIVHTMKGLSNLLSLKSFHMGLLSFTIVLGFPIIISEICWFFISGLETFLNMLHNKLNKIPDWWCFFTFLPFVSKSKYI